MYDSVIFDHDGVLTTLVDLSLLHDATWDAFDELGVTDPDPDHVERMVIHVTPADVHAVAGAYDLDPETLFRVRDEIASAAQKEAVNDGRKVPYDDFDAIRRIDAPMGIVSSNQQATIDYVLDHLDATDLFGTAYGREPSMTSLHRKKPEPYYIERAMSDLGVNSPLFVGDSDSDIVAARAAGVDSAFIRRGHRADHTPSPDPTHEIGGLDDLLDIDGVPVAGGPSLTDEETTQ
ncbi:HAD family hydrolase [Haloferax mediterranei ATCC 33500]|uniref:Hydrolase n=1 Tax=Haloferax mediterranei (strain ATCC 33500 / DSM 1411 / JCM 8866 / NBRC 14739 / NCIMB 2177 / R-4) TaxID=523841 RepID=I3R6W0_HALMT|nr:HAD family hydrolase [Haloferax mediterranei]AFK19970.1 HAD-superfamily hydrolase, subfamily IA, variant 1 [Haloferax mediterranei ATCC 33500]AHZ23347.1 hydrolase [Haloferax mediterranei ATCC 33500]ELZ99515.1 HAD-superfamily hydrolase [Haloferax mediterranei ATCC 33500]MDX5987279.1 HAD family hydrolase [Haloferax mediterranei ATCC 33500]QCQ73800.1 HAD family hydrolase [Haloferax mediterranei ATCC 33500]